MEELLRFSIIFAFIGLEYFRKGSQARSIVAGSSDKNSTIIIGIAFTVAIVIAPILNLLGIGDVYLASFFWIGIILAILGVSIRLWAMKSLGEFYTRTLVVVKDHKIIDFGPYALIRHPGYFGSTIFWIGITLSTYNLIATAIVLVLIIAAYAYRIRTEEEMLIDALGRGYKEYMKKTKKIIPFIY